MLLKPLIDDLAKGLRAAREERLGKLLDAIHELPKPPLRINPAKRVHEQGTRLGNRRPGTGLIP
ncbi:hypothetical protein ABT173_42085 [Streptomyces sp. NPDC001795]|uniref:hypothetical protein n=1 Tax=unclassified Streptomyces TaxID=2593676 RepID=UPI0033281912